MQIKDRSNSGQAEFFKGNDYLDHEALLIEVKRVERDRPGKFGPKDTVHATIHAFESVEDIDADNADVKEVLINSTALVSDLDDPELIGSATVAKVELTHFKKAGKDGPVWRDVSSSVKKKVIAYAERYEEALEAELDDAPDDFDDED